MDYTIETWNIKDLLSLIDNQKINLEPSYQRNFIWSPKNHAPARTAQQQHNTTTATTAMMMVVLFFIGWLLFLCCLLCLCIRCWAWVVGGGLDSGCSFSRRRVRTWVDW